MPRIAQHSMLLAAALLLGATPGCQEEPGEEPPDEGAPAAATADQPDPAATANPLPESEEPSEEPSVAETPRASRDAGTASDEDPPLPGPPVGVEAPSFSLTDQHGDPQSLADLLQKGPVALVFYRSADW